MKRWTLRILVLLILGAIVNVMVAWGCIAMRPKPVAQLITYPQSVPIEGPDDEEWWKAHAPEGFLPAADRIREDFEFGMTRASLTSPIGPVYRSGQPTEYEACDAVFRVRAGLPCRAMEGARWLTTRELTAEEFFIPDALVKVPFHWDEFPIRPIWPGFAINTVFYAAILFALCFGFGQGRRIIRLRRGRCPKCAYDLRASESGICPECGWGRLRRSGKCDENESP